ASPVTAPSANPSGREPPTTASAVLRYFPDAIDLVLDGGATAGGPPSTVLDTTVDPPRVLRQGAVKVRPGESHGREPGGRHEHTHGRPAQGPARARRPADQRAGRGRRHSGGGRPPDGDQRAR